MHTATRRTSEQRLPPRLPSVGLRASAEPNWSNGQLGQVGLIGLTTDGSGLIESSDQQSGCLPSWLSS